MSGVATIDAVREYWERHIHDLEITRHPVGSRGFFDDLDQYHFEKLHHLLRLVDFDGYRGRPVLEVGCGAGVDLARFAKGGARVTGVDLTLVRDRAREARISSSRALAGRVPRRRRRASAVSGRLLRFGLRAWGRPVHRRSRSGWFDECRRVLKPGGDAIFQVYNRVSWLNALSKLMNVGLEHEDAPVLLKFSIGEFRRLLSGFDDVRIVPERFPVKSRLHGGWKGAFTTWRSSAPSMRLPRALVRRFGWHLLAFCRK